MARIVAAFAASHAPMMLADPDSAPPEQRRRFTDALHEATRRVRDSGAEAVVLLSNEHFTNFFLENFPQCCVGVADHHTGPSEPWLPIPGGRVPGAPELATGVVEGLMRRDFAPSFSHHLTLDHGVMTVYHALSPERDLPLVPVLQNCAVRPMLSLTAWLRFGRLLREAIAASRTVDRVAVVATGGLSHSVGTSRTGDIDSGFDRWFLSRLAAHAFDDVLDMPDEELEEAGNGAHEIRSWLALAGVVDRPAEVLAYEPVREWVTGMAVATYDLSGDRAVGPVPAPGRPAHGPAGLDGAA